MAIVSAHEPGLFWKEAFHQEVVAGQLADYRHAAALLGWGSRGVELSHHGGDCSFETILRRCGIEDPVLWDVACIVHAADLAEDPCDAPEAHRVDLSCRGLSMVTDDDEIVVATGRFFDRLYEFHRRALPLGRVPGCR